MASGGNGPLLHLAAAQAGPELFARLGASGGFAHPPLAPVVATHLHNSPGLQRIVLRTSDIAARLCHHHSGGAFGHGLEGQVNHSTDHGRLLAGKGKHQPARLAAVDLQAQVSVIPPGLPGFGRQKL